jgi:putative CocE/NonD family hydrolase
MSLLSEIFARRMRLRRAATLDVVCERDLGVPMDDGATLLADRWFARETSGRAQPTVLVRSPYGRRQVVGLLFGRLLAERGPAGGSRACVARSAPKVSSARSTNAPTAWRRCDGSASSLGTPREGMIGPSYLGLVQWAVAPEGADDLAALAIQVSASQFHGETHAGGSVSLETVASWLVIVAEQERRLGALAIIARLRRLPALFSELPLGDLDQRATGMEVAWFREAMASPEREDAYWVSRDYAVGVERVAAPVQLIGGWQDIFLPWMLDDFAALKAAGHDPQLVIGPWTHTSPGLTSAGLRDGLGWLRAGLLGDNRLVRPGSVHVYVTGERRGGGWRELESWPPPDVEEQSLWLAPGRRLAPREPAGPAPADGYRYDPADPTPSVGGPVLLGRDPIVDNRELEARPDVLTYTTDPLESTLEAVGPVRVGVWVRASSPYFDVFARVCDVDEAGASWNVCDALVRDVPGRFESDVGGAQKVTFALWPTAHRFAAGHRIRLQVSSGAHPRYLRNPGTGEDPNIASSTVPVDIEVLHDEGHPSALVLPVTSRHPEV